jgi:HlyD family secretion protein
MTSCFRRRDWLGPWERTEPAMNLKKVLILAVVGAGVIAVVIANVIMSYEASTDVEVTRLKRGEIVEKVSGPGIIYAESSVKISSSVMGRIVDLPVREGDRVGEGDVLLRIDPSQYEANLNRAEAAHRAALARLELARARLGDAQAEYDRGVRLHERNLVSERDLELARTTLAVSDAEAQAAGEAASEAAATLSAARDDLDKTVIASPIEGTVTSLNAEQGEIVITGTMNNPGTVIMTISNLNGMEVRAEIDETDVAKVRPGQSVEISVDAFTDTTLSGTVSVVGSSSSLAKGYTPSPEERSTFDVRVRIEDSLPGLRPGMTTTVDIVTATADSVYYVPLQALVLREVGEDDEKKEHEGVFTVEKGRSRFRPVSTGISDDMNIEIFEDLGDDIPIIVGPFKTLRDLEDSTKVKIVKERDDLS